MYSQVQAQKKNGIFGKNIIVIFYLSAFLLDQYFVTDFFSLPKIGKSHFFSSFFLFRRFELIKKKKNQATFPQKKTWEK